MALTLAVSSPAGAVITPFSQDVHDAIDRGLQWLRARQNDDGSFCGGQCMATGLATLAFLEKTASPHFPPRHVGWRDMEPDDQERVERAIRWIIDNGGPFDVVGDPHPYTAGSQIAALAVYLATDGPHDVGARVGVDEALRNIVAGFKAHQGGPVELCPHASGSLSLAYSGSCATGAILPPNQFPMAGLAAAEGFIDGAADTLHLTVPFLDATKRPDGGHKYHSTATTGYGDWPSATSTTSTGIWSYLLAGVQPADERIQSAMRWLQANYTYTWNIQCSPGVVTDEQGRRYGPFPCEGRPWYYAYHYSLWALVKATEAMARHAPAPGALYERDIGDCPAPADRECHLDPPGAGYPEERPSVYFDVAVTLMGMQTADGLFPSRAPPRRGFEEFSDQAFAILALERSTGGVCLDRDEDGVCEIQDNCPRRFNPLQIDLDGDGLGDECDNCRNDPNLGQEDADGDGRGDACDKLTCTPVEGGMELCNGRDDDCDGMLDEGVFAAPAPPVHAPADGGEGEGERDGGGQQQEVGGERQECVTELPGVCGRGQWLCVHGEVSCVAAHRAERVEICDLLDNDCDGRIDEGTRNDCGRCGADVAEGCNGIDDDCNGLVDDGASCLEGRICHRGECALPCNPGGACQQGRVCDAGYCISDPPIEPADSGDAAPDPSDGDPVHSCAYVECGADEYCHQGQCRQTCDSISCGADEVCVDGGCVATQGCDPAALCDGLAPDPCAVSDCGALARCEVVCAGDDCHPSCRPDWLPAPPSPTDPPDDDNAAAAVPPAGTSPTSPAPGAAPAGDPGTVPDAQPGLGELDPRADGETDAEGGSDSGCAVKKPGTTWQIPLFRR